MYKLGPHIQRSSPSAAEWARKAWIVKSMDDVDMLRLARPRAITIFRKYYEFQDTARNGAEVAAEIVEKLHGFVPSYIELYNEHEAYLQTGLENHVRFTREATDYLHARGYKVLGFSFNVGGPEMQDWVYLRQQRYAGVDAIGLHQYWANKGFTEWRALRHRLVHQWTEGDHPPFVISECGRDAIVEEGATGRGWRAQGVMDEQYAEELEQYDAELCKDDYVIGGTVFTAGPYAGWLDFSTDGLSERFGYGDTPLQIWTPDPTPQPPTGGETMSTFHLGSIDIVDLRDSLPVHATLKYDWRLMQAIKRIVIHHSATSVTATAEQFARYHVDHHGWPGIGYHFVVTANGEIQYVNDHTLITYGVENQNADTVHICLPGDFTSAPPPEAQLQATRRLIDNYRLAMGQVYPVVGHRDIGDSSCPGDTWPQWRGRLIDAAPASDPVADLQARLDTALTQLAAIRSIVGGA